MNNFFAPTPSSFYPVTPMYTWWVHVFFLLRFFAVADTVTNVLDIGT